MRVRLQIMTCFDEARLGKGPAATLKLISAKQKTRLLFSAGLRLAPRKIHEFADAVAPRAADFDDP